MSDPIYDRKFLLDTLAPLGVTSEELDEALDYSLSGVRGTVVYLGKRRALVTHRDPTTLKPISDLGKQRMIRLAEELEKLPADRFRYSSLIAKEKTCGTVGCAIGWLPVLLPELFPKTNLIHVAHALIGANLIDAANVYVIKHAIHGYYRLVDYEELAAWVFEMPFDDASDLFTPLRVDGRFGECAVPADVALRLRHYATSGDVLVN